MNSFACAFCQESSFLLWQPKISTQANYQKIQSQYYNIFQKESMKLNHLKTKFWSEGSHLIIRFWFQTWNMSGTQKVRNFCGEFNARNSKISFFATFYYTWEECCFLQCLTIFCIDLACKSLSPFQSTSDWLLLSLLNMPNWSFIFWTPDHHFQFIMNPDYANWASSSSISL